MIDTSAFYALVSNTDEFHEIAVNTYTELIDQKADLYTTSYALVETTALIHRRLGFHLLSDFVESMKDSVSIIWMESTAHWRSWELLKERRGNQLSFVDCSIILAGGSIHSTIFAFDQDFRREGLLVIPSPGV